MKKKMEIRSLPISMNSVSSDGKLTVSGLVNGAGSVSEVLQNPMNGKEFRETIAKGVFADAIANSDRIDFLSQHDKSMILSTTDNNSLELRETDNGLEMNASITETSWGKDTFQLIKDGIIKGMSFGMRVLNDTWTVASDNIPMRTINGIELFEVSAVRNPAYKSSDIEARDIDIINDVNIPDDIEERRDKLVDKKKEVREDEEEERDDADDLTQDTSSESRDEDSGEERDDETGDTDVETNAKPEKKAPKAAEEKKADDKAPAKAEKKQTESEPEKRSEDIALEIKNELREIYDAKLSEIRSQLTFLQATIKKNEETRSLKASENKKFFESR